MAKITEQMEAVNVKIDEFLTSDSNMMTEIMHYITSNKGKQLRPKMVLLSASFGRVNDNVISIAAALEIVHMASLVHDDIIDGASKRRGKESVQHKFGNTAAVYAGDFMVFAALSKLSLLPRKSGLYSSMKLLNKFYDVLRNMCSGELKQYENLYNANITQDEYLTQIQGKTASLFQIACFLGAVEGGCNGSFIDSLNDYGLNFGMMFQIQDDLLDFVGNDVLLKKDVQSDMKIGVYTLPLIYALNTTQSREKLFALLEEYKNSRDDVLYREICDMVKTSGGVDYSINQMNNFKNNALKALRTLPDTEEKSILENTILEITRKTEEAFV